MFRWRGTSDIKEAVNEHLKSRPGLSGCHAVDLPAGKGVTSKTLKDQGASVQAFDLFPEFFEPSETGLECRFADLTQPPIPLASESVDLFVCQEGLEHLPDQLNALKEFRRVLRPNGRVLLTVPNCSHITAKMAFFMNESETLKRNSTNEWDDVWHAHDGNIYFGHVFLIGFQKLRALAELANLEIRELHPVKICSSAAFLFVFFYPWIFLFNWRAYRRALSNSRSHSNAHERQKTYREIFYYSIHPKVLLGKHLFLELAPKGE